MSVWTEIKKALNSSLGTSKFEPLDKKLSKSAEKQILSYSDSPEDLYAVLATDLPTPNTDTEIFFEKITMKNGGSFAIKKSDSGDVNIYINGQFDYKITSSATYHRVDFSAGDEITLSYKRARVDLVEIYATVLDGSIWEIIET